MIGVLVIGIAFGSSYIYQGVDTLDTITTETKIELADVAIYAAADDSAATVQDAAGYTFGILSVMDRENTDKALEQITEMLGHAPATREYASVSDLVDSILTTGETQAIVMNSAFFTLLHELEGYEDSSSRLKELDTVTVKKIVEVEKPKEEAGSDVEEEEHSGSVFSVYISGIDSRGSISTVSRSNVNIIATVNTDTHQVLLVSTPRDYYVPLSISNGVPDKLTHAGIYGINVSIETLEMLYGIDINYYFRVNFSGFEDIIDALDGITVESDVAFEVDNYGIEYPIFEGQNDLTGEQALAFARERQAFASGDRQRGKNQMVVIKAVIAKALSPALLSNYSDILQGVSGSFESSMPYDTLAELVRNQLDSGADWNIVTYSVDGSGDYQKPYSLSTTAYVMVPDTSTVNHAIELMNKVKNGETLTQESQ